MKVLPVEDNGYVVLYCTQHAYYSKKYREQIRTQGPKLFRALSFLRRRYNIKERVLVVLKPLRQPRRYEKYGMISTEGFIIIDPRFNFDRWLETACHEMCHLKQYLTGKLSILEGKVLWKGKLYDTRPDLSKAGTFSSYKNLPWEVEAFKKEEELLPLVKEYLYKYEKIKNGYLTFLED